jgi:uncharacterized membrane protein
MALVRSFDRVRAVVLAGLVCAGAWLAFAPLPAEAQTRARVPQGWEVCNETSYVLEAATGRPEGEQILMQGWLRLRPGECRLALSAPLARGTHYLYARTSSAHRGGRRQWGGGPHLCVDPNQQFSIETPQDCEAMGLGARQFREVIVSRRDGWRTTLTEAEPYSLYRARSAGLQRLLTDAGYDVREGRRAVDPRRTAAAIAQFRQLARLPANATEVQLIDALETAARRRSNELGLTLCNRAEAPMWTAIARRRADSWESRGWWQIAPGACARAIDDALLQDVYYVHASLVAEDGDRYLAAGGEPFCTSPSKFAIMGDSNCENRYYDTALFSPISARGRQGLVVEFFERNFLPMGQPQRQIARRREASAPPVAAAAATQPQRPAGAQGELGEILRSRVVRPPRSAPADGPDQPIRP